MNFLKRFRFVARVSGPTKKQRLTLTKAIAVVMWADGECKESELVEIKQTVSELGGLPEETVATVLATEKELGQEIKSELAELPPSFAHEVLKTAYRIANADNEIHEKELEVIKEISAIILPDKSWADVKDWIDAYDALLKATHKLYS